MYSVPLPPAPVHSIPADQFTSHAIRAEYEAWLDAIDLEPQPLAPQTPAELGRIEQFA